MKWWIIYMVLLLLFNYSLVPQELIHFGSKINTEEDEFLPYYSNSNLFFGRTLSLTTIPITNYKILQTKMNDITAPTSKTKTYSTSDFQKQNSLTNKLHSTTHRFAMFIQKYLKSSGSIFFNQPKRYYEFHPVLNKNNSILVFSSDRPGSFRKSDTTTDLYIRYKIEDRKWSEPYNLGKQINDEQNQITPFIDKDNNLYYSSKVFKNGVWNYDIFKAELSNDGEWINPQPLPYPINSDYNETGVFIVNDTMIFASDRPNSINNKSGFDNYDLYCYIKSQRKNIDISIQNMNKSAFNINFLEYNIPFFVTGYYRPNTPDNLKKLKEKFRLNIYGANPKTKYIANPDEEDWNYEESSLIVRKAINKAVKEIVVQLEELNKYETSTIQLIFTGYADPRPIVRNSIYDGYSIKCLNPFFVVDRGETMDNQLLSKLRAYFTAQNVKNKLKHYSIYKRLEPRITWIVKGVATSKDNNKPYTLNRKVIITLTYEQDKEFQKPIKLPPLEESNEFGSVIDSY